MTRAPLLTPEPVLFRYRPTRARPPCTGSRSRSGSTMPSLGCRKLTDPGSNMASYASVATLFFSLPNVETSFPLFIDDDHLRGIFRVFDIDQSSEFDVFPLPVFADNLHEAACDVLGAAHREIRGRSRPHRKAVAAPANIALHLKTAKRDRFVVLPVIPNAFKCTEASGMLGEVFLCPSVYERAFD